MNRNPKIRNAKRWADRKRGREIRLARGEAPRYLWPATPPTGLVEVGGRLEAVPRG